MGGLGQFGQDAAVGGVAGAGALLAQRLELFFQLAQFADAGGNMGDVGVEQRVDVGAGRPGCVLDAQQRPDFVQRHVQRAAVAHKGQPFGVVGAVEAVVAVAARRGGQQALALVVADGVDRGLGRAGQFADFHGGVLSAAPCRRRAPQHTA